jgi:hypothetical protein
VSAAGAAGAAAGAAQPLSSAASSMMPSTTFSKCLFFMWISFDFENLYWQAQRGAVNAFLERDRKRK